MTVASDGWSAGGGQCEAVQLGSGRESAGPTHAKLMTYPGATHGVKDMMRSEGSSAELWLIKRTLESLSDEWTAPQKGKLADQSPGSSAQGQAAAHLAQGSPALRRGFSQKQWPSRWPTYP